tara:strand:- start:720 stop:875 length:156 start_codon:yes stop_codon:yes gene_type:complete
MTLGNGREVPIQEDTAKLPLAKVAEILLVKASWLGNQMSYLAIQAIGSDVH